MERSPEVSCLKPVDEFQKERPLCKCMGPFLSKNIPFANISEETYGSDGVNSRRRYRKRLVERRNSSRENALEHST